MSRRAAILAFWLLGFTIGSLGYLAVPNIAGWIQTVVPDLINQALVGALLAGTVGSALSTIAVITWANRA